MKRIANFLGSIKLAFPYLKVLLNVLLLLILIPCVHIFCYEQVSEKYNTVFGVSLLDEQATEKACALVQADPSVKRIIAARRQFPSRLLVTLEKRKPFVVVKFGDDHYAVDEDGIRFPGIVAVPHTGVVVTGVMSAPPDAWQKWEGEDFNTALEAAKFAVKRDELRPLVREIDVSNFDGRRQRGSSEVVFVCGSGCRIFWGRWNRPGEIGPDEKLKNLRLACEKFPMLDGLVYLKVYVKDLPIGK